MGKKQEVKEVPVIVMKEITGKATVTFADVWRKLPSWREVDYIVEVCNLYFDEENSQILLDRRSIKHAKKDFVLECLALYSKEVGDASAKAEADRMISLIGEIIRKKGKRVSSPPKEKEVVENK